MNRKSIAKILRDFGKDYAAAAEWVQQETEAELMAADFSAFAADKELDCALVEYRFRRDKGIKSEFAWRETAGLMADYLDKAREHLLSFLEGAPKPDKQLTAAGEQLAEMRGLVVEATGLIGCVDWGVRAKKALSAAPKRGRVVWEGGAVTQHSYLHDDESCPATLVTMPDGEFVIAYYHEGKDGQLHTVTVREAE